MSRVEREEAGSQMAPESPPGEIAPEGGLTAEWTGWLLGRPDRHGNGTQWHESKLHNFLRLFQ